MINVRDKNSGRWLRSDIFSASGRKFMKNKMYIDAPYKSPEWFNFWQRERNRCINGYKVGNWKVTGDHYFYLNYSIIEKVDLENSVGRKAKKIQSIPDFWDGDYDYFWVRNIAKDGILAAVDYPVEEQRRIFDLPEEEKLKIYIKELDKLKLRVKPVLTCRNLEGGLDLIVGKARRRGFSLKNASIAANNVLTKPNKLTLLMAYEKKYLYPGAKTLLGKIKKFLNDINKNTGWFFASDHINKQNHIKNSFGKKVNGIEVIEGFESEIEAQSFKDNPDAGRGADAEDIFGEEVGAWGVIGGLKATIKAMRSSSEAGGFKTGMMTLFGCVCAGTKVYLPNGAVCNIEEISKETGIVGYGGRGVIAEGVEHLNPVVKKECVRIDTVGGGFIECSTDHPLLWSKTGYTVGGRQGKKVTFKRAEDIKVGDQLMMLKQLPIFGTKKMPYPRLIGLLIGDGYYGSVDGRTSTPQLAISNEGIFDFVKSQGVSYKVYKNKGDYNYIGIHDFQDVLKVVGIYGQSKQKKRLPKGLYEYDMESLSELIGGYYDADGNVNVSKNGKKTAIRLTSVVRPLLEEVQEALRRFGILSSIIKRKHKKGTLLKSNVTGNTSIINTEVSYSLEISDRESLKSFKKYIKFSDTNKQKRLDEYDDSINGYQTRGFHYEKTVKGEYFEDKDIDYLVPRLIKKITPLGLKEVYNLGTTTSHTYITNGFISHNTSGDVLKGTADFADLFNRPGANNFMEFHDIYGEDENKIEGFFFPKHLNTEGFYDSQGNSDMEAARNYELDERARLISKGATTTEILMRMQEEPLDSAEAFSMISTNTFPTVELNRRLTVVKSKELQKKKGIPVDLIRDKGKVIAKPVLDGKRQPITSLKDLPIDVSGLPVIYEQPREGTPKGLYKIGYDPISQDEGTSLASIIVYKGVEKGSTNHSIIAAEYIGRRKTPEMIDMIAELLAEYYNATIMFENNVPATKNYFRRIRKLHLLALQPDAVISKNIKKSSVSRVYGCHMNDQLKDAGERYTLEWLTQVLDYDENNNPITTIDKINSIRLLEELIAYNRKGNYDLVSALFMCLIQSQEEVLGKEYDSKENSTDVNVKQLMEIMNYRSRR